MVTMFDAEVRPPTRQPQNLEQQRLLEKAAELTVRIQKLRALAATLTTERDEILVRVDSIALAGRM